MKNTYIIPAQRWAIMEEIFLQSLSVLDGETSAQGLKKKFAVESEGMETKGEYAASGSLWDNEW